MMLAKAPQPATPVDFEVPAGACDCQRTSTVTPRSSRSFRGAYTPEMALPEDMTAAPASAISRTVPQYLNRPFRHISIGYSTASFPNRNCRECWRAGSRAYPVW